MECFFFYSDDDVLLYTKMVMTNRLTLGGKETEEREICSSQNSYTLLSPKFLAEKRCQRAMDVGGGQMCRINSKSLTAATER